MGYGCTAAVSVKINDQYLNDMLLKDEAISQIFEESLDFLRKNEVIIPKDIGEPLFFKTLAYYAQFTGYQLTYNTIREYLVDEYCLISSPFEAFEFMVSIAYLSTKFPDSEVLAGIGDAGIFWLDLKFKNGSLLETETMLEYHINDIEDVDAFICTRKEIEDFFSKPIVKRLKKRELTSNLLEDIKRLNNSEGSQLFKIQPNSTKSNKSLIEKCAKFNVDILQWVEPSLLDDENLILSVIESNGYWALKYASDRLKKNRKVVLAAVNQEGGAFRLVKDIFKNDEEIIKAAISSDGRVLEHVLDKYKADKEIVLSALKTYGFALEFASKKLRQDREVVLAAVRNHGTSLRFAHTSLTRDKEIAIAAINSQASAFEYVSDLTNGYYDIALKAIKLDCENYLFVSNDFEKNMELFQYAFDEVINRLEKGRELRALGLKVIENLEINQTSKLSLLNKLIIDNNKFSLNSATAIFTLSQKLEKIGLNKDSENLVNKAYNSFIFNNSPYEEYILSKSKFWYDNSYQDASTFVKVLEKVINMELNKKTNSCVINSGLNIAKTPYLTQRFIYECNDSKLKSKLISIKKKQSEKDILIQLNKMEDFQDSDDWWGHWRMEWDLLQSPIAGMNDKLLASEKIKQKALKLSSRLDFFYHLENREQLLKYFKNSKYGISAYRFLPLEYQNDKEIILQAANTDNFSARYLGAEILGDVPFIQQILQIDGSNILKFDNSILKNFDLVTTAVKNWNSTAHNSDFKKVTVYFKDNAELMGLW